MATFTDSNKSSEGTFTDKTKDTDTWTNVQHSDIDGAGMDIQTMDNTIEYMDQSGNIIATSWSVKTKETG